MKKISIIALFIAAISFASCKSISTVSTANSVATSAGVNCGKVLASLNSTYKSTGKLDLTNTTTLLNVVELASYYKALEAHRTDAAYKTAFATGLVTGSNGAITAASSINVVNSLLNLAGLNKISSSTLNTANEAISVTNGLITIFKAFK